MWDLSVIEAWVEIYRRYSCFCPGILYFARPEVIVTIPVTDGRSSNNGRAKGGISSKAES